MKKRIIPIIIMAAAAVFFLAGCDGMLEGIYPEQTVGKNTLTILVQASPNNSYVATYWGMQKVWVSLYKDGAYLQSSSSWFNYNYSTMKYETTVSFDNLKDGSYYAEAWLDVAPDETWTVGEPYGDSSAYPQYLSGTQAAENTVYIW